MNNEDMKVMARALCIMSLTLFINLVFVHLIVFAKPVSGIEAYDAVGQEVVFDDDLDAVNAGPVRFIFDTDELADDEIYLFDDHPGSTINPVEDGEYDLFPEDGSSTVSFYKKGAGDDTPKLLGTYHVSFADGIFDVPSAAVEECEEGIKLKVQPLSHTHVYCSITGPENGVLEEITDETEFLLSKDGTYQLAVYSEDGMGHRTYAGIPYEVVLDRTAPVISASAAEITEDKFSLILSADDNLTGVSFVTVSAPDKVLYRGTGTKERVDIDVSRLPYGIKRYDIKAEDLAGNTACEYFTLEKKDARAPELSLEGASDKGVYGRDVTIMIKAEDDSAGECTLKETVSRYELSGKLVGDEVYSNDTLSFKDSGIYVIRAEASDKAGNTARRSLAFAIDRKAPLIRGLLGLDGSSLKGFMMKKTEDIAEDDSLVQVRVLLNGMDYDGSTVTKSGKYRLQVLATDEFGNSTEKDASFEIKE